MKKLLGGLVIILAMAICLPAMAQGTDEGIKIAVTAAFTSANGIPVYEEMFDYVSKKVGEPVEMVSGMSYAKINELLKAAKIHSAFVCGYAYTREGKDIDAELLCAPVMDDPQYLNKPIYYSYVIVPKDSPARTMSDLKGKKYAYSDPLSNSGHNMPRYKLATMGYEEDVFFGKVDYTGAHEKSIELVAKGIYDGASVDSLVWDYDNKYFPEYTSKTKIIERHGPAGIPPVIVPKSLPAEMKKKLKDAFLGMHNDPEGKKILAKAMVAKFVDVDEANYDSIRDMENYAKWFLGPKYK